MKEGLEWSPDANQARLRTGKGSTTIKQGFEVIQSNGKGINKFEQAILDNEKKVAKILEQQAQLKQGK